MVRYSCLGKERVGVCSTFVGERLELGNKVPVYIHKNPDFRRAERCVGLDFLDIYCQCSFAVSLLVLFWS